MKSLTYDLLMLKIQELLQLSFRIVIGSHFVANGPVIFIYLMIIATFICFVPEEVDDLE